MVAGFCLVPRVLVLYCVYNLGVLQLKLFRTRCCGEEFYGRRHKPVVDQKCTHCGAQWSGILELGKPAVVDERKGIIETLHKACNEMAEQRDKYKKWCAQQHQLIRVRNEQLANVRVLAERMDCDFIDERRGFFTTSVHSPDCSKCAILSLWRKNGKTTDND